MADKRTKVDNTVDDDDDLDPVERMIKGTGCLEKHYAVLECVNTEKDWRPCQKQVSEFRKCMDEHKKAKESQE